MNFQVYATTVLLQFTLNMTFKLNKGKIESLQNFSVEGFKLYLN